MAANTAFATHIDMSANSPARWPSLATATATVGGLGYAPVAPGTLGAAAGVALHLGLAWAGAGPLACVALSAALLWAGAHAASAAEAHFAQHDDGRIVIDEVVGQLIALLPIAVLAPERSFDPVLLLLGFLGFRLFDIWKPGPVKAAEQGFEAGWGVMLDDVVAGLLAAAVVAAVLVTGVLP